MSRLSLIPKGVVIAMQVSLVSLILLATVPLALGGLNVDIESGPDVNYDASVHELVVSLKGQAHADLYFDITGFRYDISITSGGERMYVYGSDDMGISRKGSTSVGMDASVPLMSALMMLLLCVDSDDMILTIEAKGSTLGGMLSLKACSDIVLAEDVVSSSVNVTGADIGSFKELNVTFFVPSSDLADEIFGPGGIVIDVMDGSDVVATFAVVVSPSAGGYDITVNISSSDPLIGAIEGARSSNGGIDVEYDGAPSELNKGQTDLIVGTLKILYGRWS